MGVVLCKKHGKSGQVLTCSHLSNLVWNFNQVTDFVKRVEESNNNNDKYSWDWIYVLCKTCDAEYKKTSIEEFPDYFLKPICAKCFIELSELESWK